MRSSIRSSREHFTVKSICAVMLLATFAALVANAALPSASRSDVNALRPYKGYSAIRMRLSDSTSNYHSMQLYAAKRKGNLLATLSYTWSKVLTDASGFNDNPEDPFNRRFNYGPATFDRRHIFAATYTYQPKIFSRLQSGFAKALLHGYELSGIIRMQSGAFFTVTGNTSTGVRRADYVGGPVLVSGGGQAKYINAAAFASAPDTRRGTSGVGVVEGPGSQSFDFSIRKRFSLTERFKLQFQADLFNAFNRVNFRDLDPALATAPFGTTPDRIRTSPEYSTRNETDVLKAAKIARCRSQGTASVRSRWEHQLSSRCSPLKLSPNHNFRPREGKLL